MIIFIETNINIKIIHITYTYTEKFTPKLSSTRDSLPNETFTQDSIIVWSLKQRSYACSI